MSPLQGSIRRIVIGATAALVLAVVWRVFAPGVGTRTVCWALLGTAPLWIPLPWLLRGHRKTYAAFTLCVIPYLIVGITEAVANPIWRSWAALVLCDAFLLFVTLIAYLRVTRTVAAD
jgi:uncharacterized membrane protein